MNYVCSYCNSILKEIHGYGGFRLFKCKCDNKRDYNWVLNTTIINDFYPVGYWMYVNLTDNFLSQEPYKYMFVFR